MTIIVDYSNEIYLSFADSFDLIKDISSARYTRYQNEGLVHISDAPDFWDGLSQIAVFRNANEEIIGALNVNVQFGPVVTSNLYYSTVAENMAKFRTEMRTHKVSILFELFRLFTVSKNTNILKYTSSVVSTLITSYAGNCEGKRSIAFLVCPFDNRFKDAYSAYAELAGLKHHTLASKIEAGLGHQHELLMIYPEDCTEM
ncbi:hypothetical protein [Roseibium sp. RKSG952]|uniref:hypothetical protein n=1 Tax=Roseibium sp. RKSG952 TaxID=2529384 RepID=UPI0012BBE396|nr:hypothetical protein [Roseibium sp. RKSG952]MTH94833.1 hypothetical protein [Roseibium sp. RKSG952]